MADIASNNGCAEAIYVRRAEKSYGVGKRRSMILRGLDMNVKKGVIYGLLGASGCGKTTLLSCLVGRRSVDSGEVFVFGGEPGSADSGIPGPRIGYMPQELALYGEFTIGETLEYFGRIYKLKRSFVRSQMEFLFKLLDLPPSNRIVKTLSGGQQRRVSFATALFHDPELLILDEPTVGVDPQLRQNIWDHLVRISVDSGKTIIITTHYIEEARQAHVIGLMRSGRLLAEESPETLLSVHGLSNLEDVFLKLCMKSTGADLQVDTTAANNIQTVFQASKSLPNQGVDNFAFDHECKKAITEAGNVTDKDDKDQHNGSSQSDACVTGPHYRKSSVLTLQTKGDGHINHECAVDQASSEDGFFKESKKSGNHINEMNSLSRNNRAVINRASPNDVSVPESKDSICSTMHSDGTSSSSSSNVGDTNSSCGASTNTSVHVGKKRSNRKIVLSLPSIHRTSALLRKNFLQTYRNIGLVLFMFLLPVFQSTLFCLTIGDPSSLKIGIINDELDLNRTSSCTYSTDCSYTMLSCRLLHYFSNETFMQVPFTGLEEAMDATRNGDIWGVVHFPHNFSKFYDIRTTDGKESTNETIIGSRIAVTLDWSNQQIALIMKRRLIEAFEDFSKSILESCNREEEAASIPLSFLEPVYGKKQPSFKEFMAPGVILTLVYFLAVSLTSVLFITERKQGLLDRNLVAGVNMTEILLSHTINQAVILMFQTGFVFIVILCVFKVPCIGSVNASFWLTVLQGLVGMFYGFIISSFCDEEGSALHFAVGSFYPTLLLGGVMWPVEGMPIFARYFSYILPQTYAIEAMRNIFAKGLGLDRPEVYWGYSISFGWIAILVFINILIIRIPTGSPPLVLVLYVTGIVAEVQIAVINT